MRLALCLVCLGFVSLVPAISLPAQDHPSTPGHQASPADSSSAIRKYFRDCTPAESAAHDCATLEWFFSSRFKEVEETPLPSQPNSGFQFVYRISYVTPVARLIGMRLARIEIRNDSSIEIIAKTEDMNDKILTSRSFVLSEADADKLRAILRWEEFVKLDSESHAAPDHTHTMKDGDFCALEGISGTAYHAIARSGIERDTSQDPAKAPLLSLYNLLNNLGVWRTQ